MVRIGKDWHSLSTLATTTRLKHDDLVTVRALSVRSTACVIEPLTISNDNLCMESRV